MPYTPPAGNAVVFGFPYKDGILTDAGGVYNIPNGLVVPLPFDIQISFVSFRYFAIDTAFF
jgi:hypothetical protein